MIIKILDGYMANPGDLSWERLESLGDITIYDRTPSNLIVERSIDADAIFVNKVVLGREEINQLPNLKFIGVLATGYNNIDLDAAREKGIIVSNVPAYSTDSVAQTVFALLLEITNRVGQYSRDVAEGAWSHSKDFSFTLGPITELAGLTMGIYGFGNIGRRVGDIANAFGMRVVSPTTKPFSNLPAYVEKTDFDNFLSKADVISLNAPLTASNRHIINAETIKKMKRGVILINTARGPLIDEYALAEALKNGHVAGAGIDVLCEEPPVNGSPLIGAPNCYITPHIAWQSTTARKRLLDISADNLKAFINGTPRNVVN